MQSSGTAKLLVLMAERITKLQPKNTKGNKNVKEHEE